MAGRGKWGLIPNQFRDIVAIREVGKAYKFSYKDVHYEDQWADASNFRPLAFDLVIIQVKRRDRKCEYKGWWTGTIWEAIKKQDNDEIIKWKRPLGEKCNELPGN